MNPAPDYTDHIIGTVPYDVVAPLIKWLNQPICEWPNTRIQLDLPDGRRVRFGHKQYYAIKSPVCATCRAKGVTFLIIAPRNKQKNPKIALVTQDGIMLTRDHIIPRCQGGSSYHDNIQVLCYTCNNKKSITDVHVDVREY